MPYQSSEDRAFANGTPRHQWRKETRKMRWWYESLADVMVANPRWTQNELAAHFGRTATTISTIVNTDAFKAYFRQRRDQHAETLDAGVRSKMFNVVDKSLELILESLEKKRDNIPLDMLQRTAESTLKSLGYGAEPRGPSVSVNVNQNNNTHLVPVAVSVEDLETARAALRANQMRVVSPPPLQLEQRKEYENDALFPSDRTTDEVRERTSLDTRLESRNQDALAHEPSRNVPTRISRHDGGDALNSRLAGGAPVVRSIRDPLEDIA